MTRAIPISVSRLLAGDSILMPSNNYPAQFNPSKSDRIVTVEAVEPHTDHGADGRPRTIHLTIENTVVVVYPTDVAWIVVPEPSAEGATA